MADLDQYITTEGHVKFRRAKTLTEVDSKSDPANEPYKSMYEARQIWSEIRADVENFESDDIIYKARMATLHYYIGVNFVDCDEPSSGEEQLIKAKDLLESCELCETTCNVLQDIYNYIGIVWSNRDNHDKAFSYLRKGEKLYEDYKHEIGSPPWCTEEFLDCWTEEEKVQKRMVKFEESFTKTNYYLAQVLTALEKNDDAAKYCQITLRRQIESNGYEPIEWALNSATLSQYYIGNNASAARHCLASASLIISQAENSEDDKWNRAVADINRCWAKYALNLLESSKVKMFDSLGGGASEEPEVKSIERFQLETDRYEDDVTDQFVTVFGEARPVFLFGQKKLNESLKFYRLDTHCTDHVELQQEISKLYKELLFFEDDMERQCKMHKRRIDILAPLLQQLNPTYYLMICRQLMFEIAEIYREMSDLKLAIVEHSQTTMTLAQAKKINFLIKESVSHYDKYSTSFNNPDGKIPDKCEQSDLRPLLIAKFCSGRLFSKLISVSPQERVRNLEKSIERYKMVVDYCDSHEMARESVETELDLCREMVELLPLKIEDIKRNGFSAT